MAEVIINVGANTAEASVAIDELNNSLKETGAVTEKAEKASDDLAKSLERQEARIKVIDGLINVLGGSVELAAGAIVGLGLASEEGAKEFEAAALGAIAFADGAKRTFDGVKSLNEGFKAYGGAAAAARKAQAALNAVILANPYIAAGVALAAITVALVAYYNSQIDAEEATKSGTAAIEAQIEADKKLKEETDRLREALSEYTATQGEAARAADRELALAQAQGKSEAELLEIRKRAIQERIRDLNRQLGFVFDNAELENEIREKIKDEENNLNIALANFRQKRIDDEAKARQDRFDALNKENVDREERIRIHEENVTNLVKTAREQRLADAKFLADAEAEDDREAFEASLVDLEKRKQAGIQAAKDAADVQQALQNSRLAFLDNTAAAVGALANLFGQGTAAFKAAALAEIAISTATGFINALDIAQKSAKATGPAAAFAFPIFYASQIAAVLGAVAAAKNVLKTTPGGGGSTPSSGPRASSPSFAGAGASALGGGFQAGAPVETPTQPLRAYVVTGDVVNGIQAQGQIRRRRTLGPG